MLIYILRHKKIIQTDLKNNFLIIHYTLMGSSCCLFPVQTPHDGKGGELLKTEINAKSESCSKSIVLVSDSKSFVLATRHGKNTASVREEEAGEEE